MPDTSRSCTRCQEDEPGILQCHQCGTLYTAETRTTEEGLKGKFPDHSKPMIISAKSNKKIHYDKVGNEINPEE